jgi:hypothetical protein
MLTLHFEFRDDAEKDVVVNADKDWSVDRETGYVIAQSVDGSRYIVPLDAINYMHIVGKS